MAQGLLRAPNRVAVPSQGFTPDDIPGNSTQYVMVEIPNAGLVKVRKSMVAPGIKTYPVPEDLIKQIPMEKPENTSAIPIAEPPAMQSEVKTPLNMENKGDFNGNSANPALTIQNLHELPPVPEMPDMGGENGAQAPIGGAQEMPPVAALPSQTPANPAIPETGAGGIRGFLNSPLGLGIIGGLGDAMIAKSQNRKDPMIGSFIQGYKEQNAQAEKKAFADQISKANLNPQQRAFVQYAVNSGDPKLMETASKMLFSNTANKPVNVSQGGTLVDPATGKVIYQSKAQKTTNAIVNAEAIGLKQGTKEYNDFIREQTVGKSGTAFQKDEMAFTQQVANDTNLQGKDLDDAVEAYKLGNTALPDGRELPVMSRSAHEKLDKVLKSTTTGALVTAGVQANQSHAEMQVFDKYIKKGNAHYGDTIAGYSPKFEKDTFNAKTDKAAADRLSDYYVGQILNFDKAQTQIRIAMANPSVSTTEDLIKISENTIKQFAPIKSGVVKNLTIDKLSKALNDALDVRNKYGIGASGAFNPKLAGKVEEPAPSKPTYSTAELDKMAADAIAAGADPKAVHARLAQLRAS